MIDAVIEYFSGFLFRNKFIFKLENRLGNNSKHVSFLNLFGLRLGRSYSMKLKTVRLELRFGYNPELYSNSLIRTIDGFVYRRLSYMQWITAKILIGAKHETH